MKAACPRCRHPVWSAVRAVGSSRVLINFDDDAASATYEQHTPLCPNCGLKLDRGLSLSRAAARMLRRDW